MTIGEDGLVAEHTDYALMRGELLRAGVDVGQVDSYSPAVTVNLLDKLLAEGYLDVHRYVELLPAGSISDRDSILKHIRMKGVEAHG